MKVGIDISKLNSMSSSRGVGYYTKNLYESLKEYTDIEVEIIEKGSAEKFDLIHYPYFDLFSPTLKADKRTPTVVTIHDVIPLLFPKKYPPGLRGTIKNFHQKLNLKKVKAVMTDSECSKKDIHEKLGIKKEKIEVVYLAASSNFKKISDSKKLGDVKKKYSLPEKFVLYTGSTNWNKNLPNLTKAVLQAGAEVVFVGKAFENRENLGHIELSSFAEFLKMYSDNPKVHILGFIPDEEIAAVYNLAGILAQPSYYEGFGLPILEAQACGVPVITSNVSSMPEVAGKGARFVNPESPDEIKRAIIDILTDKKLRDDLINEGFRNTKRFSWEKTAVETAKIYKRTYERYAG